MTTYQELQLELSKKREDLRQEVRARLIVQALADRYENREESAEPVRSLVAKAIVLALFMAAAIFCTGCAPMRDWVMLGHRTPEQQAAAEADLVTLQRVDVKRRLRR